MKSKVFRLISDHLIPLMVIIVAGVGILKGQYLQVIYLLLTVIFIKLVEIANMLRRGAAILDVATRPEKKEEIR